MAQSTEDYLDSLLRQAMGIPEPEPEQAANIAAAEPGIDDVLAMADGLTGSNSAILGNAYDQNASFTNEGEIEIPHEVTVTEPEPEPYEPTEAIPVDMMPDADSPVAVEQAAEEPVIVPPAAEEPALAEEPAIEPPAEETVMEPQMTEEVQPEETAPAEEQPALTEEPTAPSVSINDLDPNDGAKALDADMIAALFESANAATPAADEPVIEPSVVEEPAAEPPAEEETVEEPQMLEEVQPEEAAPAAEEPALAEEPAAPSISIDDLDPNDGAKALDADMIAALFESANAATPAAEEPVIEPSVVEEPAIEPPAEEETVVEPQVTEEVQLEETAPAEEELTAEEPALAEEPAAPSISIDDLDPNDGAKALDADMIAALFESANAAEPPSEAEAADESFETEAAQEESIHEELPAEVPAPEETFDDNLSADEIAALLAGDDGELEEISIPETENDDAPPMPDQEISDLLSALDDLSGGPEPDDKALEEPARDTADESGVDLGGIDLFDTDLSAMLDDVTSSVESESVALSGDTADDSDLGDLLGSLDDGSGDLSDIGDMLGKDENSELVDPNSETAEALFASGSEDEIFDIDNLIDEEEEETKGKKKKKFSLFGKKKKKGNVETLGDGEMLIDPEAFEIPEQEETKPKKPGFFAALFARLFEEVGEEEDTSGIEQSAVEIAQEGAAENEAILSELEGEEAAQKKKGKKEKKKKDKKDKKGKGGDASDEDSTEESGDDSGKKKKKEKKEKKKKEKTPEVPGKRLPRKKVVAIALLGLTIGIVITFLAFLLPYSQDIKKAKKFYTTGEYQKTYEYMRGHKLTSEDKVLYDRTTTLLRIKRPYDSYLNYMKLGYRMEALNALVQGVQMIDAYAEDAASLGINDKYSKQSRLIYDELYNTFGVTVERARSWIELEGSPEYTRALYECLLDTSGYREEQNLSEDLSPEADDSIINAEENDL